MCPTAGVILVRRFRRRGQPQDRPRHVSVHVPGHRLHKDDAPEAQAGSSGGTTVHNARLHFAGSFARPVASCDRPRKCVSRVLSRGAEATRVYLRSAFGSRRTHVLFDRKRHSVTYAHGAFMFLSILLTRSFLFFIFVVVVLPDFASQVRRERFDEGTLH